MGRQRAGITLENTKTADATVGIEEVITKKEPLRAIDKSEIERIAHESGFVSRSPISRRIRPKSPYTIQLNFKTRPGIKEIFQEVGARLQTFDHTTFERALLALLEKEKMKDLNKELTALIKT